MSAIEVLEDNVAAKNGSFLYCLTEKSEFSSDAFKELYAAVRELAVSDVDISRTAQKVNYVYGQILERFMYHFDTSDEYKIANMPQNYNKYIEYLDSCVGYYFKTRI